jgi:hypothetical protein
MQEHGRFEVWFDSTVIYAALYGSTNAELITRFSDEIKRVASENMPEQWGHVVWLEDWELTTPETEPFIQSLTGWCIENGLIRAAQVFSPSMIKRYQLDKMVTAEEGAFTRRQFRTTSEAAAWMQREGFPLTKLDDRPQA